MQDHVEDILINAPGGGTPRVVVISHESPDFVRRAALDPRVAEASRFSHDMRAADDLKHLTSQFGRMACFGPTALDENLSSIVDFFSGPDLLRADESPCTGSSTVSDVLIEVGRSLCMEGLRVFGSGGARFKVAEAYGGSFGWSGLGSRHIGLACDCFNFAGEFLVEASFWSLDELDPMTGIRSEIEIRPANEVPYQDFPVPSIVRGVNVRGDDAYGLSFGRDLPDWAFGVLDSHPVPTGGRFYRPEAVSHALAVARRLDRCVTDGASINHDVTELYRIFEDGSCRRYWPKDAPLSGVREDMGTAMVDVAAALAERLEFVAGRHGRVPCSLEADVHQMVSTMRACLSRAEAWVSLSEFNY